MNEQIHITTPEMRISHGPQVEGQEALNNRVRLLVSAEGPKGRESLELDLLVPPLMDGSIQQAQSLVAHRAIAILQVLLSFQSGQSGVEQKSQAD